MRLKHKVILSSFILVGLFSLLYIQLFSIKDSSHRIYVCQVGIFSNEGNAMDLVEEMNSLGFEGNYYIKDLQYFVLGGITLEQEDAIEIGELISGVNRTCVIKEYYVQGDCIEEIKEGEYAMVLEELGR